MVISALGVPGAGATGVIHAHVFVCFLFRVRLASRATTGVATCGGFVLEYDLFCLVLAFVAAGLVVARCAAVWLVAVTAAAV